MGSIGSEGDKITKVGKPRKRILIRATERMKEEGWEGLSDNAKKYFDSWKASNDQVFIYETSKGKAFTRLIEGPLTEGIVLGSTGGGAGTGALLATFERVLEDKNNIHGFAWTADNEKSVAYYKHLGLDKYAKDIYGQTRYIISRAELRKELERLDKKYRNF